MRVLFAISMLAFAVLLWASVAIVQHVRRSRRRRRRIQESVPPNPVIAPGTLGLTQMRAAEREQVVKFVDPEEEELVTFVDPQRPAVPVVARVPAPVKFAAPARVPIAVAAPTAAPAPVAFAVPVPVAVVAPTPAPVAVATPVPTEAEAPVAPSAQAFVAEETASTPAVAATQVPLPPVAAAPLPRPAQASAPVPAQVRPGSGFFRARPQVVTPPPVPSPPGPRVAGLGAPWPEVRPLAPHPPLAFPDGVRMPMAAAQAEYASAPPRPTRSAVPVAAPEPVESAEPEAATIGHFSRMPGWPLPDSAFPQSSDPVAMPLAGRSASGKRAVAAVSSRADLEYYKEEMGDLSDPEPPRRSSRELKAVKDFSK